MMVSIPLPLLAFAQVLQEFNNIFFIIKQDRLIAIIDLIATATWGHVMKSFVQFVCHCYNSVAIR
jgi:hypothetical protein